MSLKTSVVKLAIKMTPDIIVKLVANVVLKDIAKISEFTFDFDTRTVFVQLTLNGEDDQLEVSVDGFAIESDQGSHQLLIQKAQANRTWLNNILARITGKPWKIPAIPQYQVYIEFVSELLNAEKAETTRD